MNLLINKKYNTKTAINPVPPSLEAAQKFLERGWQPIPVPRGSKRPVIDEWQKLRLTTEELTARFCHGENVGVLLGEPSGWLVDVDLDCTEAITIAGHFLPDTGRIFGRPGKRRSHRLFVCKHAQTKQFKDAKNGNMLVELRSTGGQTIFPPSVHQETGEFITWEQEGEPLHTSLTELETAVSRLAAAALLARHWPGRGSRQDAALCLAGGLIRAGWDEAETEHFISAVCEAAHDEEPRMRARTAASTARKTSNGSNTKGFASLVGFVGDDVINNVRMWLKIRKDKIIEWGHLEEIKAELPTVEPLPPAIIPRPLRAWLTDISHRMQCPLDFVAAGALVVAGAVVGAGCGIRPKRRDDWLVVPNLWGGIVARPSMLKTPSLVEIMKPVARLEAEAKEVYETESRLYQTEVEFFKAQKEALKSEMLSAAKGKGKKNEPPPDIEDVKQRYSELDEPEAPVRRRFKTNDATIEKISELLNENPRGILLFRDELIGLLVSWDREGRESDRAFYLESWNGYGNFTTDRIGRGTIDTQNLCVSILGGIQPAKLLAYLHQAMSDMQNDGLLQRMQILVYPDEPQNWKLVDEYPDTEAKNQAWQVFEKLAHMDFLEYGAELFEGEKIPFFHFSDEGQSIFNEWIFDLEVKLRGDEMPALIEHFAKYRSLMPALALIIHLTNIADGKPGGPVSAEAAKMAAGWCEYLESHARRVYALSGDIATRAAAELAKKIKAGKVQDGFTLRDIYRNGWHLLDKKEIVQEACRELVEANWLRQETVEIPGRQPKEAFRINPNIFLSNV